MSTTSDSALVTLIKQRREALLQSGANTSEQLVFLDNRLTPTPENILRDPVLNPYDKILWQGILSIAQTQSPPSGVGGGTVMPTYDHLSRLVNVSRMSIATSIAALRATRWLIVNQIRDDGGAMRGQLYVIAYQPWDLGYALDIDDRYIDWLETQTVERRDQRIQRIATAVWDTITEDRRNGVDITAPVDPIEKTLEAGKALQDYNGRFYAIGANALKALTRRQAESLSEGNVVKIDSRDDGSGAPKPQTSAENDRVRNSYSVESRESKESQRADRSANSDRIATSSTSSSNNIYKEPTTSTERPAELQNLVFPPGLRAVECQRIGSVLLGLVPNKPEAQQMLLDELAGRMKWGKAFNGAAAAWFKGMTQNYIRMKNDFIPNYADKYASFREQQAKERAEQAERDRPPTAAEKQRAMDAKALIRQTLSSQSNRSRRS